MKENALQAAAERSWRLGGRRCGGVEEDEESRYGGVEQGGEGREGLLFLMAPCSFLGLCLLACCFLCF